MRRAAWAIVFFALLCVAGAAAFFLLRPRPPRAEDLSTLLPFVDSALSSGSLDTARGALESITVLPSSEEGQLRVLKRALLVCSLSGDFRLMADLGRRALAGQGRSPRVRAAAVYALLRTGRVAEAGKIGSQGRLPPSFGDLLTGEGALRQGHAWAGSDGLTRDLLTLESNSDPLAFSAAAVRTGDARLSLDAALLFMQQGRPGAALQIVKQDLSDAAFDEPSAAIEWDAGEPAEALDRLTRLSAARPGRAEIHFRIADCLMGLGRAKEAERSLMTGLRIAPRLSWTAYANLGFLASQRGDAGIADRFLQDGLAFFPGSRELLIAHARNAVLSGREEEAIRTLTALLAERPADGEAALLLLDVHAPGLSPEQYQARLWKLFNRSPAEPATFTMLAGALLGAHDWDGASNALDQHEAARGTIDPELLLVRGMIAAMKEDMAAAEAAFRRAASERGDGRARYDLALMLVHRGRTRAALRELDLAAEEYGSSGSRAERDPVLSRIAMLNGTARMIDGDEGGARNAFARALMLDPRNLRASLLLRKLEARVQ